MITPSRRRLACLCLLLTASIAGAQTPPAPEPATIRGVVLDRSDGSPIADVPVQVQDARQSVKTDAAGRFELTNVEPGRRTLYVSLVGFILVKRTVVVAPGETIDVTIVLSEGTGTYSEEVTVTAGERFREQEKSVPSQQTLGSADIQNLRNLLTNDPMRAIQVLPGVTTGDDFRSEFAVRGSGFSRMNFTFDGIPNTFLLHTIQQVDDGGSIAMVNGDILDGITLLNGSYPQRYGNRVGAELDFHMRDGSRERLQTRVGISGTDASIVAEGPIGHAKSGAWLFSARKSYLELLLKQIDSENDFGFGFSDVQSKVVYDVSSAHRLELSVVAGRSRLDQETDADDIFEVQDGRNAAQLVNAAWRFSPSSSVVVTNRVAFAANQFVNTSVTGFEFHRGDSQDLTWRADVAAKRSPSLTLEGGGQVQWQHRALVAKEPLGRLLPAERLVQEYDERTVLGSAYAQAPWTPEGRVSLTPGVRVDRWSLTGDTSVSPWVVGEVRLGGSFKLRGGTGVHHQFPGIDQAAGTYAAVDRRAERAVHADLGIERTFGPAARVQLTFYNREERGLFRLRGAEPLVVNDRFVPDDPTSWSNALDGYARGVELLVQRRSPKGLTGWLSYSYGVNRYHDRVTDESFDGDYDQRHTFNAYGLYRLTDRFSVAAKLRVGSNTPATGYWEERAPDEYYVSARRNTLRVPAYARLDLRGNRTFNWQSKRLTLFVELLNAFGHDNQRFTVPGVDPRTRRAFGLFESMIPFVPSAGILLEF